MNRTVSSNRAGSESFEGLLERLTRGAGSGDAQANLDPAFVSGSSAGAASLRGTRRRMLAPVTEAKSGGSKADNMPLSYETALRLHARRNLVPETDLRNPVERGEAPAQRVSQTGNQAMNRDQEMASTKRRTGRPEAAQVEMSDTVAAKGRGMPQASVRRPAAQGDQTQGAIRASAGPQSQVKASTQVKMSDGPGAIARKNSPARTSAPAPARPAATLSAAACGAAKASNVQGAPHGKSSSQDKSSKKAGKPDETRAQSARLSRARRAKTADPLPQPGRQLARRDTMQPEELRLELPHTSVELEHRRAVVSIRLNDSEIERLRQRAAESGISVSAYMRSCVLEAEHLRAQVKQALAEMRASIQPMALPTEPMGATGPALLPSRLAVLSSAGGGNSWPRLLWKSATFLLGPWFFFRHRA
jgi:hypothetical protein